jgi:hypothetical protein
MVVNNIADANLLVTNYTNIYLNEHIEPSLIAELLLNARIKLSNVRHNLSVSTGQNMARFINLLQIFINWLKK